MHLTIRPARREDASALLAIYAPYITDSTVSFELTVPTEAEFAARIEQISQSYPYLVCEADGEIAGYAYAAPFAERAAYQHSADLSLYIAPNYKRRGIGRMLYDALFEALRRQGVHMVYAVITGENEDSLRMHTALGFSEVGHIHQAGYKFNRWIDVIWMEKML